MAGQKQPWAPWVDPYRYPVPEPAVDPWDTILTTLLKKDKVQCDAWKDEVQNLLIFAGLFSAVITGFVVDSYKTLQTDPNTAVVLLLSRIVDHLNLTTNTSQVIQDSVNTTFSSSAPNRSSIRVNTFWFLSLILSLTTVLVGIVCLQWLRDHQRYTEPLTPKEALAVFHMRADGLKNWGIPQIFTGLPLLLQTAVVLFFAGLVDFLFSINRTVAIPVVLVVVLTLLFLIGTTVLPGLQCFTASLCWSSQREFVVSQCPYKSPQAWVFRRFIILTIQIYTGTLLIFDRIAYRVTPALHLARNILLGSKIPPTFRIFRLPPQSPNFDNAPIEHLTQRFQSLMPVTLFLDANQHDWIEFDNFWLTVRDRHSQFLQRKLTPIGESFDRIRPPYDLVRVLVHIATEQSMNELTILAIYHCFEQLSGSLIAEEQTNFNKDAQSIMRTQMRTLQSCFFPSLFQSMSSSLEKPSLRTMHEESMIVFLNLPGISPYANNPTHPLGVHLIELHTRLWLNIFFRHPARATDEVELDATHPFFVQRHYLKSLSDISKNVLQTMVEQHYHILNRIFEQSHYSGDPVTVIPGYPMLNEFMDYISFFRPPESLENSFLSVITTISKAFNSVFRSQGYDTADFTFFCSRLYLEKLAKHQWFSEIMKFGPHNLQAPLLTLLNEMLHYEYQLEKSQYMNSYNIWMSRLQFHTNQGIRTTGEASYVPIPELLLRFLPYESRLENSIDYTEFGTGHASSAIIQGVS